MIKLFDTPSLFEPEPEEPKRTFYKDIKNHWFIPRGHRYLPNGLVDQILTVFNDILIGAEWDKSLQAKIRAALVKKTAMVPPVDENLNEISQDIKNSGTIRTLVAEFIALGIIYRTVLSDSSSEKKKYTHQFTKAGLDLLGKKNVDEIFTHLLCRVQFSNSYFRSGRTRMNNEIVIKPFLFIMKLLFDPRLSGYIMKEEFYIPIILAKSINDFETIVEKILKFRLIKNIRDVLGCKVGKDIINQSFRQLMTSRNFLITNDLKKYALNIDNPNINIIENYLKEYTKDPNELISPKEHGEYKKKRIIVNQRDQNDGMTLLLEKAENFSSIDSFTRYLKKEYPSRQATFLVSVLRNNPDIIKKFGSSFEETFLNPKDCLKAEEKILELFKNKFDFESYETGRKRNQLTRGNHSDILNVLNQLNAAES